MTPPDRPHSTDPRIRSVLLVGIALALATPVTIFLTTALLKGLSAGAAVSATIEQLGARRLNLLVMGALGVVPFACLGLVLWLYRRFDGGRAFRGMAVGGGITILATMAWANGTYWRLFLPERVAPMWPHGLELVIGPLFFAPVLCVGAVGLGWIVDRVTRRT